MIVRLALVLLLFGSSPAVALDGGIAPFAGARVFDRDLQNFRWERGPVALAGVEGFARMGRWEGGLVLARSNTEQALGLPGEDLQPGVALTEATLRLRGALVVLGPFDFGLAAGVGRTHLGYDPDRASVAVQGLADPLELSFPAIDTWRRELAIDGRWRRSAAWAVGVGLAWSWFDLETAYRSGDTIVEGRDTFSSLDVHLQLRWTLWGLRGSETP